VLYDTLTREETLVASDVGKTNNHVSADGIVKYWTHLGRDETSDMTDDYNIVRWHDGESMRLTEDTFFWNVYPRTDGNLAVYSKQPGCCGETPQL